MNPSKMAIERPVTTLMIFLSVVILGIVSLDRLPVQFMPDISPPWMGCYVRYRRSMSTEEQERNIIKPIEGYIAEMPGVKNIWSFGRHGTSCFFRIQFEFGTNTKFRAIELQEKLDLFRRTFPKGSLNTYVFPFDTSRDNSNFMGVAIQGPRHDPHLQGINVERIAQKLSDIEGVAQADTWGGHNEVVEVAVHEDRMQEFNQPLYRLTNTVRSYAADPVFVGNIEEGGKRHFVRIDGQFKETQELEDIVLDSDGGLFLRHLGQVNEILLSRNRLYRVNGLPATTYMLEKESEVNPLELSDRVRKAIERIKEDLPPGYGLTVRWDSSEIIRELIQQLARLAAYGIILAMLILHAFVRSFRMTLMVCLVIPISIVATFNLMYFSDMSINLFTLVGLAIGVGSLLDNSIVVLENIARHRQHGRSPRQASFLGASEVTRPIVALTLTSIIVFLPIVFLKSEIQIVFTEGALAVVYPLLVSMAVALLLVPMAATYLFHRDERRSLTAVNGGTPTSDRGGAGGSWQLATGLEFVKTRIGFQRFRARYLGVLKGCLRHRARFILVVFTIILYTYYYTMSGVTRGQRLEAPQDQDWFTVYVFAPKGTRLAHTVEIVDRVEDLITESVPERDQTSSRIMEDFASINVRLVDQDERDRLLPEIKESLRQPFEQIGDADVSFEYKRQRGDNMPSPVVSGGRGSVVMKGPDQESLLRIIEMVTPLLEQVDGVRDVYADVEHGDLELQFTLDRDTANLLQVNAQSLAWQLSAAQSRGDVSQIRMKRDDEEIDIVFQQVTEDRPAGQKVVDYEEGLKLAEMRRIPIFSPTLRATVPLENLGSFEMVRRSGHMFRMNQQRIVRVIYSLSPNAKQQDVEASVRQICENYPLPAGFSFELGGFSQNWEELIDAFRQILWLALILVYMLMAALFESFYQPFVILFTIVLAFVPIIWGLILTDTQFSEMAVFGIVFLIGLLPNSGILLVNFASAMRREKKFPRPRAVFLASAYRLRPILMTVGTTALGLAPMAIKTRGNDGEWIPFAVVVISGLLGSTVLTLLLIPGLYFIFEDVWSLIGRGIHYVHSLRWVLVFWSKKRRTKLRERVTAYRLQAPREEPLRIETWNLTRIYARPFLLRVEEGVMRRFRMLFPGRMAPVGLVAGNPLPALRAAGGETDEAETLSAGTVRREKALAGVHLDIERGLFGLLGPNGAGKTTLIRLLVGIDQPTRGTCKVCGYDIVREGAKVRSSIGYLPQDFGVYGDRTARDYLRHFALLKGMRTKREREAAIDHALEMVNLTEQADTNVGGFSGGMMRRIGLAQIFLKPPKVLVVDEPTAGLDPLERLRFRNLLTQLATDRVVVLSTHIVEDVAHSCRRLAVLQNGAITYHGEQEGLLDTARGHVVEIETSDEEWAGARALGEVTTMQRMAGGLRLRLVCADTPPAGSRAVEPTLEDAYVYHTVVADAHVNSAQESDSLA